MLLPLFRSSVFQRVPPATTNSAFYLCCSNYMFHFRESRYGNLTDGILQSIYFVHLLQNIMYQTVVLFNYI